MEETFRQTRLGALRVLRAGPPDGARAVLCWPGLGLTAQEFHRVLREGAQRGVPVLAVDPPGHGRSAPAPEVTWADLAEVLRDLAAELPSAQLLLVGHSAGATALLYGARGLADRVAGIVLGDGAFHDSAVHGSEAELSAKNEEWLRQMTYPDWESCLGASRAEFETWDEDLEAGVRDLFAQGEDGMVRARGDLQTLTRWSVLLRDYRPLGAPLLDVPVLALWAGEDPLAEPPGLAALRTRLQRLEARCLVGSGHELFWDQPAASSDAIWRFFDEGCDWAAGQGLPRPSTRG